MKFLGLRLCDHDSNVSYTDGKTVKYIKSERLHQIKHHGYSDFFSYQKDIEFWNINYSELDAVCIIIDEIKLDFPKKKLLWQKAPQFLPGIICPIYIIDHHYAHSLSCWPIIDLDKVDTAFVFDGVGDFNITNSIFKKDERISYSTVSGIGNLLARLGRFAGMEGHDLDLSGKVMALKSYGSINEKFIEQYKTLSIIETEKLFKIYDWLPFIRFTDSPFESIKPGTVDWMASVHSWIENKMPEYFLKFANPDDVITFSGGVAQNICINSRLKSIFKNLYVIPHNPDDGLSLGGVEFLRRMYDQPPFSKDNFPYWQSETVPEEPSDEIVDDVVDLLADGKVIGWFQGQGEIGPRALGNRSILMRPDIPNGKDIINSRVKFREEYRPFGCSVLEQHVSEYFECDFPSPYMLYSVPVKKKKLLSSITHVDGTSRIQSVNKSNNILFYKLLEKFYKKTGMPILLNTSLNINKTPIVSTKDQAMEVFNKSAIDAICIGDKLFIK